MSLIVSLLLTNKVLVSYNQSNVFFGEECISFISKKMNFLFFCLDYYNNQLSFVPKTKLWVISVNFIYNTVQSVTHISIDCSSYTMLQTVFFIFSCILSGKQCVHADAIPTFTSWSSLLNGNFLYHLDKNQHILSQEELKALWFYPSS